MIEDDQNQQAQVHVIRHDQDGTDQDRHGAQDVHQSHRRAAGEAVGEDAGRDRDEKPRKVVGGRHNGDGEGVGVDQDREERNRSVGQPVARAGKSESDPEAAERAAQPAAALLLTRAHGPLGWRDYANRPTLVMTIDPWGTTPAGATFRVQSLVDR